MVGPWQPKWWVLHNLCVGSLTNYMFVPSQPICWVLDNLYGGSLTTYMLGPWQPIWWVLHNLYVGSLTTLSWVLDNLFLWLNVHILQTVYECIDKITQFMSRAAIFSFLPVLTKLLPESITCIERGRYYRYIAYLRYNALLEVFLKCVRNYTQFPHIFKLSHKML